MSWFKRKNTVEAIQTAYNNVVKLARPGLTRQKIVELTSEILSAGAALQDFTQNKPLTSGKVSVWYDGQGVKINIVN